MPTKPKTTDVELPPDAQPAPRMAILGEVAQLMGLVTDVPKTGEATFGDRYKFRKVEETIQRLGEAARAVGIMLTSELVGMPRVATDQVPKFRNGEQTGATTWTSVHLVIAYHFTSLTDGSRLTFQAAGEGRDSGDKATAKAMSNALKYALGQALLIGTGDEDPDAEKPEIERQPPAQGQEQPPQNGVPESKRAEVAAQGLRAAQQPGLTRARLTEIWNHAERIGVIDVPLVDGSGTITLRARLTAIGNTLPADEPPEES